MKSNFEVTLGSNVSVDETEANKLYSQFTNCIDQRSNMYKLQSVPYVAAR